MDRFCTLWPEDLTGTDPLDKPHLTVYPAPNPDPQLDGAGVMIMPGGAYMKLAEHEGDDIARWLNRDGFHAAVLWYRLAPRHEHPAMLHDAQRGMRLLRKLGPEFGLNPGRIGAIGFSAGGHLAATLAAHCDEQTSEHDDLAPAVTARPNALVLGYPVLDMQGAAVHRGSRKNLLGRRSTDANLRHWLSPHLHVTDRFPPTFAWHTADDAGVSMDNSIQLVQAARQVNVPAELHVFESGRHGLGLANEAPDVATWCQLALRFLKRHLGSATHQDHAPDDAPPTAAPREVKVSTRDKATT